MSNLLENLKEDNFFEIIRFLKVRNEEALTQIKEDRILIKKLELLYKKDIKQASNKKKIRKNNKTGFTKINTIPLKLSKLLNIDSNTKLSRIDLTKKIWEYIKKNNLYYEKDHRVLRADKKLLEIFNLDESVNSITNPKDKNGFTFYTIQSLISKCFNENI